MAHRYLGQHLVAQMRRDVRHAPPEAAGAEPAALTAEGDDELVAAAAALKRREAVLETLGHLKHRFRRRHGAPGWGARTGVRRAECETA